MNFEFIDAVANNIIDFAKLHQQWLFPIVLIISFGESLAFISLIFPATIILFTIGAFMSNSEITLLPIWFAASLGAFFGDWISYLFGIYYKDKIYHIWPFKTRPMLLHKGFFFFKKHGVMSVFIGRFFGPLRAAIPLIAGICRMDQWHFFIANALSAALWAFGILAPGYFGLPWLKQLFNF